MVLILSDNTRKDTITEIGHSMVEETMGEVLSIMSEV